MSKKSVANATLDELLEIIDTNSTTCLVGFLEQSPENRRKIRQAAPDEEHGTRQLLQGVLARKENGGAPSSSSLWSCCSRVFDCLAPVSIMVAAVRGYASMLRYRHCEVAFWTRHGALVDDSRSLVAVGVHNQCVFIEKRNYDQQYYWVHVRCPEASLFAMLILAVQYRGTRFSMEAMSKSPVLPGPDTDDDRQAGVFCSQLTMKLLSLLPYPAAQLNRANAQTVDDIFDILRNEDFHPDDETDLVGSIPEARLRHTFGAHTSLTERTTTSGTTYSMHSV
jgi:hypothetical protein